MKLEKQSKIDTSKKAGSLAFFTAIPVTYVLCAGGISALCSYLHIIGINFSTWSLFIVGSITPIGALLSRRPTYIKTFIHESKHAALVILSGNKLKDMHVRRDSGLVTYEIFEHRKQFGPFIILAPYFFPIFSLPTLLTCLASDFFELGFPREVLVSLLGLSLATDCISSFVEFHPHQTDLKRIYGGKLFVLGFLVGINALWLTLCLLYVAGGITAIMYALARTANILLAYLSML